MTELSNIYCSHNRLSAFGVIGTFTVKGKQNMNTISHNRLSAFGVIGTGELKRTRRARAAVTIAFRLLG